MHEWEGDADGARRQFLRSFLHDLATPLSAVSLHLEGASRRSSRGDDPSDSLNVARAELSRAFELFELGRELLLAKSEHVETFAFDEWVEATVSSAGQNGVTLEGRTQGRVTGDRARLSEALSALLANALESASADAVTVTRERSGDRLQVRVENPGQLPGDDPEKLFAPRSSSSGRNWGMGLARARLYAADAGGSVRLRPQGERVSAVLVLPEERT